MIYLHLKEILCRFSYLIISFLASSIIAWEFRETLLFTFCKIPLIYINLSEAFFSYIYLALAVSLVFNIPYIIYVLLCFLTPGLFKYEYQITKNSFISLLLGFYITLSFYIMYLLPLIVNFFSKFDSIIVQQSITLNDYVQFLLLIINVSFFTLLIPTITFFIKIQGHRKWLYILVIWVSALITPPDIISLLLTSIPTLILFELMYFLRIIFASLSLSSLSPFLFRGEKRDMRRKMN